MAAGTVTILGPYPTDGTGVAAALSAEAGAIVKSITSWQDLENRQVWFAVCTEA